MSIHPITDMVRELEIKALALDILEEALVGNAIILPGREMEKRPCRACRIDPARPLEPGNIMATTSGAIGVLTQQQIRELCSEVAEVPNGRCTRARTIREAAQECKALHPTDTAAFFSCYIPRFREEVR